MKNIINKFFKKIIRFVLKSKFANKSIINVILSKGYIVRKNFTYEELQERSMIIPLDQCTSWHGFGYGNNGWNPFVELIREYQNNPNITFNESVLKRFYDKFDLIKYHSMICNNNDESYLDTWPIIHFWYLPENIAEENKISYNIYFGLNEREQEVQHQSTIDTYKSIKQNGYKPELFTNRSVRDGFINVVLLKKGKTYRYLITNGQHRIAALSALNYKYISATFEPIIQFMPSVIDLDNIENFPIVKHKIISRECVVKIFSPLFKDFGREKAIKIGVIPK